MPLQHNKQGCSPPRPPQTKSRVQLTNNGVLVTGSSLWQGSCPFWSNYLRLSLYDISSRPLDLCYKHVLLLETNKCSHKATEQWMCVRLLNCEITEPQAHRTVCQQQENCLSVFLWSDPQENIWTFKHTRGWGKLYCEKFQNFVFFVIIIRYDKIKDDVMGWTMKHAWVRSQIRKNISSGNPRGEKT